MPNVSQQRSDLKARFLGEDIPRIWCPPLTHYRSDRSIDHERMAAHWRAMHPAVQSFMVPGSTSDGWELSDDEASEVIDVSLDLAGELGSRMIIAALGSTMEHTISVIENTLATLHRRSGHDDALDAIHACGVAGFVVCAPPGENVSQATVRNDLAQALDLGLPVVLYQIPQFTGNRIAPQTFADLADEYPNLIMFKDSSGEDHVARADAGASGVHHVRGAEGDYEQWAVESGGPYGGFLLSTANCFGTRIKDMLVALEEDDQDTARAISDQLTRIIDRGFAAVCDVAEGNAFTNANKAIDHFMAHGPDGAGLAGPMLHAGIRLGPEVLKQVQSLLHASGLMPQTGYLHQ